MSAAAAGLDDDGEVLTRSVTSSVTSSTGSAAGDDYDDADDNVDGTNTTRSPPALFAQVDT